MYNPIQFAEKFQLAREASEKEKPLGGLCGFELEWNLVDSQMRPLLTVGSGPGKQSFVDYLRAECLAPWSKGHSQLEVFHWMIEWATRPYYMPRGAVFEGRMLEATLYNALERAGRNFGDRLYAWHGNLLLLTKIGRDSIPYSWNLAKRRYLERCVDLYGESLATAGTHTNLSLPDQLFAWDFVHLSPTERGDRHLDEYKSEFYITATRLMRGFATLFIATSAATPLQARTQEGKASVVLTPFDSVRNLTFPNPPMIDLPDLYRSYQDYMQISYDQVRRGVRFGNNNWMPVRARSYAEPVERLIAVTSGQLQELYDRGLYASGQEDELHLVQEMASQIEIQNLLARINLPMVRVEIRTDDGGHPLDVEVANLTLKHLLIMRFYADPQFGRAFRYDREDIYRARRNENLAARHGLRSTIENPLTGKPVGMREFLKWTLAEVQPLAEALNLWEDLTPLVEMASGDPNTAERMRARLLTELCGAPDGQDYREVPLDLVRALAQEREQLVSREIENIAETFTILDQEATKIGDYLQRAREDVHLDTNAPIRFRPRPEAIVEITYTDKTGEILALAQQLVRIPSVTACPEERLGEVRRAATLIYDYARDHGLEARYFNRAKYPAILINLPGQQAAPVMLSGHFDVVMPEPDDSQCEPHIEGDYLLGRGAADMKTVVATYLVWIKDQLRKGSPFPPVNILLVGNEENGEIEPMGTPHVLRMLADEWKDANGNPYAPSILIAGERTGERGDELWGEICIENRGVMRFDVIAKGVKGHSGTKTAAGTPPADLTERLLLARAGITGLFGRYLTLSSPDGWQSQARFPFIQVGIPGVYNVSADYGVLGAEVRPIPQDNLSGLLEELEAYCTSQGLEIQISVKEGGIACNPDNPYLQALIGAVRSVSGKEPVLGRKLPGTSARFAPAGQGVVWGQTGIGPHARNERHFIPSILPYYNALNELGRILTKNP